MEPPTTNRFVLRKPTTYSFLDFYYGGFEPPNLPKIEQIARSEAKKFVKERDFMLNLEDMIGHAMVVAVQVYDAAAHVKCQTLDQLHAYYRTSLRKSFINLLRKRVRQLKIDEETLALEVSIFRSASEGETEEAIDVPVEDSQLFRLAYDQIVASLEEYALAKELFFLFLGANTDDKLQGEFELCLIANSKERRIDLKRLCRVLAKHGWRTVEGGREFPVRDQEVWSALSFMRRTVYSALGEIPWEESEYSLPHPRELPKKKQGCASI